VSEERARSRGANRGMGRGLSAILSVSTPPEPTRAAAASARAAC